MMFPDVVEFFQQLSDLGVEVSISGKFSVDDATYRQGYTHLYALYEEVVASRERIEARAAAIAPGDVSALVDGITIGAHTCRMTVHQPNDRCLSRQLRAVEVQVADLLTWMHTSYVTYLETDNAAALNTAKAAPAG